jgi:exodeoxyribonuclease V alpha subunit
MEGTLADVRYHQGNFLIGVLDSGITVKGQMPSPQVGLLYSFRGRWEVHPTFGRQFAFTDYSASYPVKAEAIQAYLQENCKGIGPETARRLTGLYGKDTLDVCKEDPARVAKEVKGLTRRRAAAVAAMLRKNEDSEKLHLALKDILGGTGVNRRAIGKVIEKWGEKAPDTIKANPYALIEEIDGIGFLTADQVAQKLGYEREGEPRLRAGIVHTLKDQAFSRGHVCLPERLLHEEAGKLLGVSRERLADVLSRMKEAGQVVQVDDRVFSPPLYEDEQTVAEKVRRLVTSPLKPGEPDFVGLAHDQREALAKAVNSMAFILTGAPGTGKTYTIRRILSSFPRAKVAMAAPTGKAAKRMMEQTGQPALTIHKLLGSVMENGRFRFEYGKDKPLPVDMVILDEVSMVDVSLMARFLEAVAPGTRLILVGDTYQLPPVGPGNVLKDLISSGVMPFVELTRIKRQDPGLIITNCHRIKDGKNIQVENETARDFFFMDEEDPEAIRSVVMDLVARRLPAAYEADPLRHIQVISPLRERTALSCKALNEQLQEVLNPQPKTEGLRFKKGDRVIQTKNQYDLDIVNGDIGFILHLDKPGKSMAVAFENPERTVELPLYENYLELAYAVTCHKYQGSEARIIVIPVHRCFGPLIFQRSWAYTAISRAREVCILVGQREELANAARRNHQQKRFTGLAGALARKPRNREAPENPPVSPSPEHQTGGKGTAPYPVATRGRKGLKSEHGD